MALEKEGGNIGSVGIKGMGTLREFASLACCVAAAAAAFGHVNIKRRQHPQIPGLLSIVNSMCETGVGGGKGVNWHSTREFDSAEGVVYFFAFFMCDAKVGGNGGKTGWGVFVWTPLVVVVVVRR